MTNRNSGRLLWCPAALIDFKFSLENEVTSFDVQRAKCLHQGSVHYSEVAMFNLQLLDTQESIVLLSVSLFMVCCALRLECVMSTYSFTPIHLALRTSYILWSSAVIVTSISFLVVVCCCGGGDCNCGLVRRGSVC